MLGLAQSAGTGRATSAGLLGQTQRLTPGRGRSVIATQDELTATLYLAKSHAVAPTEAAR
jgi:hypothetical protein